MDKMARTCGKCSFGQWRYWLRSIGYVASMGCDIGLTMAHF